MKYQSCSHTLAIATLMLLSATPAPGQIGQTEIAKWQYGKRAAVSLTYDDGSINQFRVAVPLMDSFGFLATFFIITGEIPGSRYHGTFIGRPTKTIIAETANVPTNKDNFFERASAIGFSATKEPFVTTPRPARRTMRERILPKRIRLSTTPTRRCGKERSKRDFPSKPSQVGRIT